MASAPPTTGDQPIVARVIGSCHWGTYDRDGQDGNDRGGFGQIDAYFATAAAPG
jgi:hypothetical protein